MIQILILWRRTVAVVTTILMPQMLSAVVNGVDGQNLLFAVVILCVDDAKVEQKAGQLCFTMQYCFC